MMSVIGYRSLEWVWEDCQKINKERLWQWISLPEMSNVTQHYYLFKVGWLVKVNPWNMPSV